MHDSVITFKKLTNDDISILVGWFSQSHVNKWWPILEKDEVVEHFLKRIRSKDTFGYIAYLDKKPFGYIQYYYLDPQGEKTGKDLPEFPAGTVGTDQFIGEVAMIGKGLGTRMITEFINYLATIEPTCRTVIVDPEPTNYAAMRCYEKVGFKKVAEIKRSYGPIVLMRYDMINKGNSMHAIDLTHTVDAAMVSWNGDCGFQLDTVVDYDDCASDVKFHVQKIVMQAGIGTHIDAPAHCVRGGQTIDQLSLNNLVAPCVVIDVCQHVHERYSVTVQDITTFESAHGIIPPNTFVIIRTGWERFWSEPEQYRNNYVFPSVSLEAAHVLLQRNIVGLGIDTLSPDRPEDGFVVHAALLGAGKYIVENVANLEKLPVVGSYAFVLPPKIGNGTEAPVRLIAVNLD